MVEKENKQLPGRPDGGSWALPERICSPSVFPSYFEDIHVTSFSDDAHFGAVQHFSPKTAVVFLVLYTPGHPPERFRDMFCIGITTLSCLRVHAYAIVECWSRIDAPLSWVSLLVLAFSVQ